MTVTQTDAAAELPAPFGPEFAHAMHTTLTELRETCPVAHVRTPGGTPVWLVLRNDDVRACLTDPRLRLSPGGAPVRPAGGRAMDVGLMNYDQPEHGRVRKLANSIFTAANVVRHRPAMAALAERLLADCPAGAVDLMVHFARPFAFGVLCEVFDLPTAGRDELYGRLQVVFDRRGHTPTDMADALDGIEALVRRELERRVEAPGRDVVSALLAAWQSDGGLDHDELVSLCGMLLIAGFDSTAQMIGISTVALTQHRTLLAELHADPDRVPAAVEELLRWETPGPFTTPRWTVADLDVGGTVIPAGHKVILSLAAANRDPRKHADAEALDPDRPRTARNLAFGIGPHYCPGAALARLELVVAIGTLTRRCPQLALAVPVDELNWIVNPYHRRLPTLPVLLGN